ncbi:MAG: DUF1641 domain-containing protein [Bryobacteraceae bacterium]|nr:DUF1641 domain-containing protein [Bryobacteraceae bacterium]
MSTATLAAPTPQEQLQARLADPRTVNALNRLLDRLDVIAGSVEMVESFLQRGSDIADNVAESVASLRTPGGDDTAQLFGKLPTLARAGMKVASVAESEAFDRLLQSGLLDRLSAPGTLEALNALLDKLPLVAFSMEALEGFCKRGDEVANSIADSVADIRSLKSPEVANVVERLPQIASATVQLADLSGTPEFAGLVALSKDLGKPEVLSKIRFLLDKLDLAVFAVSAVEGFVRRGDEVADSMAEGLGDLKKIASSINTEELSRIATELPTLTKAGHELIASGLLEKMHDLTETGMVLADAGLFDAKTVKPLAEVGRLATEAYTAAKSTPARQYGLLDLLRLFKDPQASKAIHLLVEMARQFGKRLP